MSVLQSLILFKLADNVRSYKITYKPYSALYASLPKHPMASVRGGVASLVRAGDIEKIVRNGVVHFALTLKGFASLTEKYLPREKKWDGRWRVIIFHVKETERGRRDRLRKLLRRFRFGRLKQAVYISPFNNLLPVIQSLKEVVGEDNFLAFEVEKVFNREQRKLASLVFNLPDLAKKYDDWIEQSREKTASFDTLLYYYDSIMRFDPGLPEQLLPDNFPRRQTLEIFERMLRKF